MTLRPMTTTVIKKLSYTLELIKFSHTLFALPFALAAYLVATRGDIQGNQLLLIILCVLLARTGAMAFNRLADSEFDAKNPRTQNRHLPSGLLSKNFVILLTILSSAGLILAASQLNRLALWLSPVCLLILFFYSITKRFTHYTHFFLGLALGAAPIGAYIAATGTLSLSSLILGIAVLFWVAGFDLLYALQDLEFDRDNQLHSLPVKLGVKRSFQLSSLLHLCFFLCLLIFGKMEFLGIYYWIGVGLTGAILFWEHWILKEDLKKIEASFFTANGLLSLFFLAFTAIDLFLK